MYRAITDQRFCCITSQWSRAGVKQYQAGPRLALDPNQPGPALDKNAGQGLLGAGCWLTRSRAGAGPGPGVAGPRPTAQGYQHQAGYPGLAATGCWSTLLVLVPPHCAGLFWTPSHSYRDKIAIHVLARPHNSGLEHVAGNWGMKMSTHCLIPPHNHNGCCEYIKYIIDYNT